MNHSSNILKSLAAIAFSLIATSSIAQDQIARQTNMQHNIKDVHAVTIGKKSSNVSLSNPAAQYYADWKNENVWSVSGYMPANTKIDLRGFAMPTNSRKISSPFGQRWGRLHAGLDIKVYTGDTIVAAFDGKIRVVKYDRSGYGYYVLIRHPYGLETLYGHLSKQLVKENDIVKAGQPIGLGGNTGRSTGSHLHFETRIAGTPINPAYMFDFEHQDIIADYYTTHQAYGKAKQLSASLDSQLSAEISPVDVVEPIASAAPTTQSVQPAPTKAAKSSSAKQQSRSYKVKSGDTLSSIAKKQGISVAKLRQKNNLKGDAIRAGQILKI